jgi:hypothetical protein
LDADELQGWAHRRILQAEFNDLPNALHESVEVLGLGMASPQGGNGGDVIAVFVSFDDNCELPLRLHEPILARKKQGPQGFVPAGLNLASKAKSLSLPHPSFSKNKQIVSIPR